jgi:hypothetical protein
LGKNSLDAILSVSTLRFEVQKRSECGTFALLPFGENGVWGNATTRANEVCLSAPFVDLHVYYTALAYPALANYAFDIICICTHFVGNLSSSFLN